MGGKIRVEITKRDNYECQECKRKGRLSNETNEYSESDKRKKIQLVVHRIMELELHTDLALDEANMETVCVDCHNKVHGRDFKNMKLNKWQHDEKW